MQERVVSKAARAVAVLDTQIEDQRREANEARLLRLQHHLENYATEKEAARSTTMALTDTEPKLMLEESSTEANTAFKE